MLTESEMAAFNAACRAADSVYNGDRPEPLTGNPAPAAHAPRRALRVYVTRLSLAAGALLAFGLGLAELAGPVIH